MPDSTQSPSPELIAELARVINPEAFGEDADEVVDDPAVERAWASLYATRVAEWLVEHDHAATLHARQAYALEVGNALLAILPRVNPEDDRG